MFLAALRGVSIHFVHGFQNISVQSYSNLFFTGVSWLFVLKDQYCMCRALKSGF